jgi:Fanconi anemia group M protein
MKTVFNIFPKRKFIKKRLKQKIIIDYREKNSLVASELIRAGFRIEFKELKVADYIVKDIAIERKTVSDFISSMINKRLLKQLEELQQYQNKLLIIEGVDEQELYNEDTRLHSEANKEVAYWNKKGKSKKTARLFSGVNPNAIRGFLLSIVLKHKIPTIFTKNSEDTAKFILILSRKKEKELPLNVRKKSLNKKEQLQFIVESFPGIGPKTAKKLLEKFKTIKKIANCSQEGLKQVIGKKAEVFRLVEERY